MTELAELFSASMRSHHNLDAYAEAHPELKLGRSVNKAEILAREIGVKWALEPDFHR